MKYEVNYTEPLPKDLPVVVEVEFSYQEIDILTDILEEINHEAGSEAQDITSKLCNAWREARNLRKGSSSK
jgi:hypothetical protein